MSADMDALVEKAARAIRASIMVGPFGPNAMQILSKGGTAALTPDEALDAATAALEAAGLPALLEHVEAAERIAEDLAAHGLRFDLNPTSDGSPTSHVAYIKRMDDRARDIGYSLLGALIAEPSHEQQMEAFGEMG